VFPSTRKPIPDRVDRFVDPVVPIVERGAERRELAFEVTGTDPDDEPALAQDVERRQALSGQERVPVGQDEEVGMQSNSRRRRCGKAEGDERVECVVAAHGQPCVTGERVVGRIDGIEPS
jgi:hypothetical protein